MRGKLLREITDKYEIDVKFSNLLQSNFIKSKYKMGAMDYYSIGITLLKATNDFPKTMYFLDEIDRHNRLCYLKNLYLEWDRLDKFVIVNQYERDLYEEDMCLFLGEIEDVFGKQLINNVLAFYKNHNLYIKVKRDIVFENK